ncbi:glycosyltransferase [Streptomyces fuscichromogenes]|uniref:glycosyltransferase n=1 Tax=Streptomyces fuscichromogenes TaxID=1324013 RepID=UPI001E3BF906|nr:glycosyltransferase [Streptomyces fuscichromogenes]
MSGDARLWCDRLVRGLGQHEFDLYALSRTRRQEDEGLLPLPPHVSRVRTAPLWTAEENGTTYGRRARRRFAESYGELAAVLYAGPGATGAEGSTGATGAEGPHRSTGAGGADGVGGPTGAGGEEAAGGSGAGSGSLADRFGTALRALAELARDEGGLVGALRSDTAVRALERACRAPGALATARGARVPDLLVVAAHLERALRPLSLDWYGGDGLGAADLCHATAGGPAALAGLLAGHFFGVPLLVTEYGVQLRSHYLASGPDVANPAVRAPLAAFHGRLAAEVYRRAAIITPGNAHARRWQERCGADRARIRTVHPGMAADRFTEVGEAPDRADPDMLVWVGRIEPTKDLMSLLHAFAEIRKEEPKARLRIVGAPAGPEGAAYLGHCRALAAQLFPDEAEGVHAVGDNPVAFEEIGGPEAPTLADAYASGAVVVLSSVVEGFPVGLVEAMFCGRATVSTDVGAVVEVIGGTGLVVPPRNPRALAQACVTLLRDPERRERLGAAARARALELFTVEQNVAAFDSIYLEIVSHCPVRRVVLDQAGEPLPFAVPAEAHMPGRWTGPAARVAHRAGPGWAPGGSTRPTPVRATPLAAPEGAR